MIEPLSNIYRSDQILGLAGSQLCADLYRHWGAVLARMLPERAKFVVTADHRSSSGEYKNALVDGLLSCGVQVIDVGTVPCEMASFGAEKFGADGFASVGGGSRPPEWNGLRWQLTGQGMSTSEQIEKLRDESCQIKEPVEANGSRRHLDIMYSWVSWLQNVWFDTPGPSIRILVDPLYGNWSGTARKTLQAVFPHFIFEAIHDRPEEDFGGLIPTSRCPNALETLCREVDLRRVDLGIGLDADAGYFTLVDGNGIPLLPEELAWMVLRDLLGPALEGEILLHDVNCSQLIIDEAVRWGATPIPVCRGDESFIAAMKKTNALIGLGSESEIYFRGARSNRIVLFAVCWLIDYLAVNGANLTEWRKTFPRFYTTSEIRTPSASMNIIADRLSEAWSTRPLSSIEGFRFHVPGGRIQIRSISDFSQTGFHFEADDRQSLQQIVTRSSAALKGLGHLGLFLNEQFEAQAAKRFY